MTQAATVEILIQIRDELAGLNKTRAGIKDVKKDAESLGSILKAGFGIGAGTEIARRGLNLLSQSFQASIGDAFRLAEQIKDQSEALNMTTDAYQVMRFELMQAGVDAARMTMAFTTQTQSLAEARVGVGAFADAYKQLGLKAGEIEKMRPEERMIAVARAVENSTDKTRAFQAAGQLLGSRGLPQLLNGLRNLAENGYDNVAASARSAGKVMAEETVIMLEKAKQRIDDFKSTTLPVAAGTLIGWTQGAMETVGAAAGNFTNALAGRAPGYLDTTTPKPKTTTPAGPAYATDEQVLLGRTTAAEVKASQIQSAALLTENEKRKAMLPILREQEELYQSLIQLRFGDAGQYLSKDGKVTEEELAKYQQRNELEAKLVAIRQQRMQSVDTPLAELGRSLADTTDYAQRALSGGVSTALDNLTSDLVAATNGTKGWGDAWNNLKGTAASTLQSIITRMLVIQSINAVLGIFGYSLGGASGGIVKMGAPTVTGVGVKAAGGGSFITSGPTNFTVGDNPGGIERVDVTPISGVGRSTINGQAIRMAGGGSALVGGRGMGGGDTFNFAYSFNGGVSRQEVMGLIPTIVEASKSAVLEAKRRGRDGFR